MLIHSSSAIWMPSAFALLSASASEHAAARPPARAMPRSAERPGARGTSASVSDAATEMLAMTPGDHTALPARVPGGRAQDGAAGVAAHARAMRTPERGDPFPTRWIDNEQPCGVAPH